MGLPHYASARYASVFNAHKFTIERRGRSRRYYLRSRGQSCGARYGYSARHEIEQAMDDIVRLDLIAGGGRS